MFTKTKQRRERHKYGLVACAASLMMGALMAPAALQAQNVTYAGVETVAASGLGNPAYIAQDPAGDLYVSVPGAQAVVKIPAGTNNQVLLNPGSWIQPEGLYFDQTGTLWVSDEHWPFPLKIAPNGTLSSFVSALATGPASVALDSSGDVYVCDTADGLVEEFSPSGNVLQYLPTAAFLTTCRSIAVGPNNAAYGAYPGTGLLSESPSGGATTFNGLNLTDVKVDPAGNIWVVDQGNGYIREQTTAGVQTIVEAGLTNPTGLSLNSSGNVILATETSTGQVLQFNLALPNFGNVNVCPAGQAAPAPCSQTLTWNYTINSGVTVGGVNVVTQGAPNLDFTLGSSTCTGTFDTVSSCTVNVTFAPQATGLRRGAVELTDADGNILATTDIYGNGVAPVLAFPNWTTTTLAQGLGGMGGMALDASGNVYVAYGPKDVLKVSPAGTTTYVGTNLTAAAGVAVDGAGNLFVVERDGTSVTEVPASGAAQMSIGSGLNQPNGIAVDGAGDIFVADALNSRVLEIFPNGTQTTVGSGWQAPLAVAVDGQGDVWVADSNQAAVVEVTASGAQNVVASGLSVPNGVAVDAAGDVFISQAQGSVVEVFPNGSQSTIDTGFNATAGVAVDGLGNLYVAESHDQIAEFVRSQPTLNFEATTYNTISGDSPQSVILDNIGNAPLAFTGLTAGTSFAQVSGPGTPADCSTGSPVAPGAQCNISISFTPQAVGTIQSSMMLSDNSVNGNPATQYITLNGTGQQATQSINFATLPATVTYGSGPIALSATASSGLPVTFTAAGSGSVSGSTLTITGAGVINVYAAQAGNADYAAAQTMSQSVTVNAASQTITFTGLPATATYGSAGPYNLSASASSGLPVSYSVTGPASISGSTLTISGAGSVVVTAAQAGNSNYSAATSVSQTITVSVASQTITFTGLPATATYGSAGPYTLNATASSGLPVSYSVTGPASLSGSTLTITGAGSVVVTASQAGNSNYAAAAPVSQTITVGAESQTITFASLPSTATYGSAGPYTLSATASSGLPVSFSVTGPASISGSTLTITGAGTVVVTASQAGNSNYAAATSVSQTIKVSAESQTISFAAISTETVGTPVALGASASSGLPVSFASLTSSICTVSGTTATMVAAGTCTIQASQPGNANYAAATPVSQSFTVNASASFTITPIPASETVSPGVPLAGYVLELKSVNGFDANVTLSCSSSISSSVCVDLPQTVKVDGTALALTGILFPSNTKAGTYTITFTGTSGSLTETATATFTVK